MKGDVLKRFFRAVASEDSQAIQSMMAVVVEEERKLGHTRLAAQLENINSKRYQSSSKKETLPIADKGTSLSALGKKSQSQTSTVRSLRSLTDKSRFHHSFIVTIPREQLRHHMVLPSDVESRFRRIEQEYAARDRLANHGLKYRQKILLYGSPGCGKTMGAERIAWNIGLPLVKVRFDAMVSSYLGETASNLRELFETASTSPCLLFIDEFDAIAKSREDRQEVGEVRRVVNTFLQLLDEYEPSNGMLVAATNLTQSLDQAVWRRFDDVIKVPKPTKTEIRQLLEQSLSSVEIGLIDWDKSIHEMTDFSAAQVVRVAQDAAKRAILDREELVIQEHLQESIKEIKAAHA